MDHAITVGEVLKLSGGLLVLIIVFAAAIAILAAYAKGFDH